MNLLLLMSLQAVAAPPPPPAPNAGAAPIDFDLAHYRSSDDPNDVASLFACAHPHGNELVVCGRRKGYAYPLDEMANIYEARPLRAQTSLGGGAVADVHVEQVDLGTGLKSNRAMVGIKLPF